MGTVILTSLLLPGDTGSPLTLIVSITFTCAPAAIPLSFVFSVVV
nr:MAG TPA: hypothetical protein [Caudoviricetes sp.]